MELADGIVIKGAKISNVEENSGNKKPRRRVTTAKK
jgi:hypothetical protein